MTCVTEPFAVKEDGDCADDVPVGPDVSAEPRTRACPSCGASARPDASFCGQCYADFRPPPPPPVAPPAPTVPAPSAAYGVPAADPLTQPLLDLLPTAPAPVEAAPAAVPAGEAQPTWPCTSCGSPNPFTLMACGTCGSAFLAAVREQGQVKLVLPLVGDIGAMRRAKRLGVACAVAAGVIVPLALVTLLLTDRPDDTTTTPDGVVTEVVTAP